MIFRIGLVFSLVAVLAAIAYTLIFSTQHFSYTYLTSEQQGEQVLEMPTGFDGAPFENGRVPAHEILHTYAGTAEDISSASVRVTLRRIEEMPDTISLSIRRSYRAFFLPEGDPLSGMPEERVLAIDGLPYLLMNEMLHPLTSEAAALSWTTAEEVLPAKNDTFDVFPLDNAPVGYRPGTLLSDEREIFVVDGEGFLRPVPTLAVFEALGFSAEDVLSVDSSDFSTHTRGAALTASDTQPDGTILFDVDTNRHFLVEDGKRHLLESEKYRNMFLELSTPITVTSDAFHATVSCELVRHPTFRNRYLCTIPTDSLDAFPGRSYEFSLNPNQDIEIENIEISLHQSPNRENFDSFFRKAASTFVSTYRRD